jgi:deoxyribodipyrimidine photo-lyase
VDERPALQQAKEHLYGLRKSQAAHQEADKIQQRHGSRKSGLPLSNVRQRRAKVVNDKQGELF